MEDRRFDAFVRRLATGTSRRRFVSSLAGLAAGGWLVGAGGIRAAGGIPCSSDDDCPGNLVCGDGICRTAAAGGGATTCQLGGTCDVDGDCCPNEVCCFGVCSVGEACGPGPACESDGDCGDGQTCVAGRCYIGCVTGDVCKTDSDCCPTETCIAGLCQIKQEGTVSQAPATEATSAAQQGGAVQCPPCPNCPTCPAGTSPTGGPVETPPPVTAQTPAAATTAPPAQTPAAVATQPVAAGGVTVPANVPRPVGVYKGSCGQHQPEQAYRLFDIGAALTGGTPVPGSVLGQKTAIPVEMSATTIDAKLSDLLASPFTIDVFASATDLQTSIACGDIGGTLVGKDLSIGIGEKNASGYSGVAWLRDAGAKTLVYVFLGEGLSNG